MDEAREGWILLHKSTVDYKNWPVGRAVTRLSMEQEVCDIFSNEAVMPTGAMTRR